ncbi:MAG: hypothetical protein RMK17_02550 [bacterium]|nr:hypothetical protein [bacterium]
MFDVYYLQYKIGSIRTDGQTFDIIEDLNNFLYDNFKNLSFEDFTNKINRLSAFYLKKRINAVVYFDAYIFDNGDLLEITSDNKTVLLNKQMLSSIDKHKLLNSLKNNSIKISRQLNRSAMPLILRLQEYGHFLKKKIS